MKAARIEDTHWVRGAFGLAPMSRDRRMLSIPKTSADYKFGDTTFGGNAAINPAPQFTRFADIKATGLFANKDSRSKGPGFFESEGNSGSFRMGRHYSEVFDDNQHLVHLRFGVPKYCGAVAFFANMYDREMSHLAKTGEYTSILRSVGKITGIAAMFYLLPPVAIVPLIVSSLILKAVKSKKMTKYYYLKPTMNLYLQAVQAMADTQLLHHQLVPMWEPFVEDRYVEVGDEDNKLTEAMAGIQAALPDIWLSDGRFDIFKAVNRYQVLANYQAKTLEEIYNSASTPDEVEGKIKAYLEIAKNSAIMKDQISDDKLSMKRVAEMYSKNPAYQMSEEDEAARAQSWNDLKTKMDAGYSAETITDEQLASSIDVSSNATPDEEVTSEGFWGSLSSFFDNMGEQLGSELKDGGQWITLRVDGKGSISDNISNSTKEPSIASTMNSISSSARSLEVSTSGGNTGFGFIDDAMKGVKQLIGGALDSLELSGLSAIYGTSQIIIPEVWESSSTNVGTQEITIQLRSPYGNDFSIFQNITLPLCFILAGCLPLATGKQTYTSPFIVEMFSRGRQNVRLGIFESVSINRGVGNMGWRVDGKMLACDVTITIKELSKVVHMPLIRDPGMFDDDNAYTDYMATIGGASLHQMTYQMEKVVFNLNKWRQSWKSRFMPGRITSDLANSGIARMMAAFTSGTAR